MLKDTTKPTCIGKQVFFDFIAPMAAVPAAEGGKGLGETVAGL
jgi:hypothetical protein